MENIEKGFAKIKGALEKLK